MRIEGPMPQQWRIIKMTEAEIVHMVRTRHREEGLPDHYPPPEGFTGFQRHVFFNEILKVCREDMQFTDESG